MEAIAYILLGILLTVAVVWGRARFLAFAAQKPEDYDGVGPAFEMREHLNGPILCEGVIYGPTGRVSSRFVADMDAKWTGDTCVMTEAFRYDTGETQDRIWTLNVTRDGVIEASAPDVIGTGHGRQQGSSVLLNYRIKLPESSGGHELDVTDWMYLIENGTIINRSQFRKFGVQVAELVATMRPHPEAVARRNAA
jgi:hypothetical protein